jgi:predicted transcriptional regulator
MTSGIDATADGALEDIAYLSRSANRVGVLDALATGAHTRRELMTATDVSRTTLGRILNELAERGWAERTTDGDYVATPTGEHVVREFLPSVEAMNAIRSLDGAVAWLPTEELSIGLHHFGDATVRRSDPNAPVEPGRRLAELLRDASTFATLTYFSPPLAVGRAMREGVVHGELSAEHVLAGGLVGYLRERPDDPPGWREYVDAGARVYRYDGHIPCNLFVVDETVFVPNDRADTKHPGVAIETENETVRSWAHGLIETYRADAQRVDAETFA